MAFKLKMMSLSFCMLLQACAMLPYENDYSCHLKDNYGKCIGVEDAYQEAVTGKSQGAPLVPGSKQKKHHRSEPSQQTHDTLIANPAYSNYRTHTYEALSRLIEQPKTAMLKPPVTIRTLILAYAPDDHKETLYMPRYIYSVIDDPQWVLGQYLVKTPQISASLADNPELHA